MARSAGTMVMANFPLAVAPFESVTVAVNVNWAAVVGVPLMPPAADRLSPPGNPEPA